MNGVCSFHRWDHIGGVMAYVFSWSVVIETQSLQTKDYKTGICCFSAKNAALRSKSKDWLAWNHDNVSKCSDMSTSKLLLQCASTIKIQLSMLV